MPNYIQTESDPPGSLHPVVRRLIRELKDEADLCRNETAHDVASLLDEAADALTESWDDVLEYAAQIAERYPTQTPAGEDVSDGIAAQIRKEIRCPSTK